VILIKYDDRAIQAALGHIELSLKNREKLMDKAGRTIRDYVRDTMKMQGRNRPYAPLAHSTRQTTGRRLVFTTIRPEIKHYSNNQRFFVYHDRQTTGWNLSMHVKGIRVPSVRNVVMMIPNGLGRGKPKFFRFRYPYTVPAREIWPSRPEVIWQVNEVIRQWIADVRAEVIRKYREKGGK
jgi:hypothetical protein